MQSLQSWDLEFQSFHLNSLALLLVSTPHRYVPSLGRGPLARSQKKPWVPISNPSGDTQILCEPLSPLRGPLDWKVLDASLGFIMGMAVRQGCGKPAACDKRQKAADDQSWLDSEIVPLVGMALPMAPCPPPLPSSSARPVLTIPCAPPFQSASEEHPPHLLCAPLSIITGATLNVTVLVTSLLCLRLLFLTLVL